MKTITLFQKLFIAILIVSLASCSSDDDAQEEGVACTEVAFFADADGDGLGDASTSVMACENETLEGFVLNADDNDDTQVFAALVSGTIENLFAPQTGGAGTGMDEGGAFTKFDFETGLETTSDTEWDIAFRGTTIAVNGGTLTGTVDEPTRSADAGAAIEVGTFDSIVTAEGLTFLQDDSEGFAITTGSDNGWYNYDFINNVIAPIPGKILVFRTRDGRYAKVEIRSYYLDQDTSNIEGSRYYTFDYTYNPNLGLTNLE